MKGAYLFIVALLIVLAIPLFADHALVNPVSEFSAISIFSSKEEVAIYDISAQYREIECLEHKSIKQTWLPLYRENGRLQKKSLINNKRLIKKFNIKNNRKYPIKKPS